MSIILDIDKAAGRITATVHGPIAFEDLQETLSHLVGHHDFDSRMDRLWDLRQAEPFMLTPKIKSNARSVRELLGGPRAAVLAPEDDARLQPLYSLFVESRSQVFRNLEVALEWLVRGRPRPTTPGLPCVVRGDDLPATP